MAAEKKSVSLSNLTKRFRIILEESFAHERPENKTPDRRWYEIIPCQGFKKPPEQEGPYICLHSEVPLLLKLYTDRPRNARSIWETIKGHPLTKSDFGFGGEAELLFPPELLKTVAEMAGARKRRVLSPEHKMKLAEAGKATRFNHTLHGSKARQNPQKEAIPPPAGDLVRVGGRDGVPPTPDPAVNYKPRKRRSGKPGSL